MSATKQIIPTSKPYVYVDEPAEFRALAAQTEAKKKNDMERIEAELRERNRQRREARQERDRIVRNCKLLFFGVIAACCGISALLAWKASYPALAIFPAVLTLISLAAGVRE